MPESPDTGARPNKGFRRKLPCTNHPTTVAVSCCEVCGKPICRRCVGLYPAGAFCSSDCWESRSRDESQRLSQKKREREKRADLAVTLGLWGTVAGVLLVIGFFVYQKVSSHSGEKLWELDNTEGFYEYFIQPDLPCFFALSNRRTLEAIDVSSGQKKWKVKLPDPTPDLEQPNPSVEFRNEDYLRALIVDAGRCIVFGEGRLMMCKWDYPSPKWTYQLPHPVVSANPSLSGDRVIAASRSKFWYERYDDLQMFMAKQLSTEKFKFSYEDEVKKPIYSGVSAVNIDSGIQAWSIDLENLLVSDLLTDEKQVYFVAYSPRREGYGVDPAADCNGSPDCEEEDFTTQLWALDLGTGNPVWKLEAEGSFVWPPTSTQSGVLFATKEFLYLVSPSGEIAWKYPLKNTGISELKPYEDDVLFILDDGLLNSVGLQSGNRNWSTRIGSRGNRLIVSAPLVFASALERKESEQLEVIPTKRWRGQEDLLKKALKKDEVTYEGLLCGIDLETGEVRWTIPKISGEFQYGSAYLYAVRHVEQVQIYNPNAEVGEISRTISHLRAFDSMSGEKQWEINIDGFASDMQVTQNAIIVTSAQWANTPGIRNDKVPIRLIGISL